MCKISIISPKLSQYKKTKLFKELKKFFYLEDNLVFLHENCDDCFTIARAILQAKPEVVIIIDNTEGMAGCYGEKIEIMYGKSTLPHLYGIRLTKKKKALPHPKINMIEKVSSIEELYRKFEKRKTNNIAA